MSSATPSSSQAPYAERFSDTELAQIIEEGFVYMCACPAQVATAIRQLRELYRYQQACLADTDNNPAVHTLIERTSIEAHAQLEACMDAILTLEGWDRATLCMPAGLRKTQLAAVQKD